MRVISYGGGVQSTALVVLAADGKLGDIDAAVFANVGDDSEHPATLAFVRDVMVPWAADRGLSIHEVRRPGETLLERITQPDSAAVTIPMRSPGMGFIARDCTADFKRDVVSKWLRKQGASYKNVAEVLIGISLDEIERANNNQGRNKYERRTYPLLDLGLTRQDCSNLIARAGLPVPPKSACWFCPLHGRRRFAEMRRDHPAQFEQVDRLERAITERQVRLGRAPVYMTGDGPLADIAEAQDTLFGADGPETCDDGYCWT